MKTKQESIFSSKTLTYFLQLAETMNYTQASQILGITQPALTQQIKKLERTVGAPLFYSVGKKLRLSDAGYTMLEATHQIYGILNQATDEIQQSTSATQGEINIGLLASVEDAVFEDFAIGLYQSNPDLKISFHMLTRKEVWERLENNKIDLAIMYLPDDSIKNWKPYESKKIISDDLLFIHHDEQLSKKRRIKFKDTTSQPWAMYPEGYYLDQTLHEAYKNQLADFPQGVVGAAKRFVGRAHRAGFLLFRRRVSGAAARLHQENPENAGPRLAPRGPAHERGLTMIDSRHIGSTLEDFLREENRLEEARATAL